MIGHSGHERNRQDELLPVDLHLLLLKQKDLGEVLPLKVKRHATLLAHHIEWEGVAVVLETLFTDAHTRSKGLDEACRRCESALASIDIGQSRYCINFAVYEHDELGAGLAHLADDISWFINIKTETLDEHLYRGLVDIIEHLELVFEV